MRHSFEVLHKANYMSLTTFRKSGEPVAVPVWFALRGDKIYMLSAPGAGKLKRLAHTKWVEIAPCNSNGVITGESVLAVARVLAKPAEKQAADCALTQKYGWQKKLFDWYKEWWSNSIVYLEITTG